ncbi:hypothetical protein A0H81_08614 [Grifola frondosa]|uniref:Uncharacterized protein n=1 Tax=Grifola frondosa TaxID=5627 RepID=A0A1C7M2L4_GRIFR|nr:hypothetical protein A0H81_08614 [Grifola frondosa]
MRRHGHCLDIKLTLQDFQPRWPKPRVRPGLQDVVKPSNYAQYRAEIWRHGLWGIVIPSSGRLLSTMRCMIKSGTRSGHLGVPGIPGFPIGRKKTGETEEVITGCSHEC